jgi:hypothetical protein
MWKDNAEKEVNIQSFEKTSRLLLLTYLLLDPFAQFNVFVAVGNIAIAFFFFVLDQLMKPYVPCFILHIPGKLYRI